MNQDLWRKVREVFAEAHRLPAAERGTYLERACGDDGDLLREVSSLLSALEKADGLFEPLAPGMLAPASGSPPTATEGMRVGTYRIVREIGAGGMGDVYEAVRDDGTFQRRVAVKFIRSSLSRREMTRRFEAERAVLASLQHHNIAQLIDAGSTDDGAPYLVMEFVDGRRIDEFCDERQLGILERLRLFQTVCGAVRYAHQHLVVHRDIKPGNILVTADGAPKLLDFGIAKLLTEDGGTAEQTRTGYGFVTPEYASPEQLRGEPATTVSDVYALGTLLYKLLTGGRPYDFRSTLPLDMSRTVLETEPTRPSGREISISVAGSTAGKVRRMLDGDIDAIVLMALRKEPDRRYQSAQDLSDDIGRYLAHRPVLARRGEARYRAGKFVRRHRTASIAGALVALAVVGGIGGVMWQARRAQQERDIARVEATKARRINEFLRQMIAASDDNWYNHGTGPQTSALDILDAASARLEHELTEEPGVKAELHMTVGNTYLALGESGKAAHHFSQALKLRRESLPADAHAIAESEYYLAGAYAHLAFLDQASADSAEAHYRRAIGYLATVAGGADIYLPYAYEDFGSTLMHEGRLAEAESCIVRALPLFTARYGEAHVASASCFGILGQITELRGDARGAEALFRRSFENLLRFPDRTDVNTIESLEPLARLMIDRGAIDEADTLITRYLPRPASPAPYPRILLARSLRLWARLQAARGRLDQADRTLGSALRELKGAPEDIIVRRNARVLIDLERAKVLIARGAYAAAEALLRKTRNVAATNNDRVDHVAASCDALLAALPRARLTP
ncbi:MAG TPA: serine/threonine-protein kinase [Bacteroidota bacterium]|nr:serine/threonine-protein kinase [Bacteroidota bacterium]